ncbi:MAG: VWA domain-containing protein [Candidatus Lokiarchaeota archaeon]|nr:VWA domain-containing protein [Candidatus Lokiarchaeota archaeon]
MTANASNKHDDPWSRAKAAWSRYVRLQEPALLDDPAQIEKEGIQRGIAQFGLANLRVVVNLVEMDALGLTPYLDIVLAHEIGHHTLAPGNLLDDARLVSYVANMFPGDAANYVVNIFTDLIVNDFLRTQRGMPVEDVYKALKAAAVRAGRIGNADKFWALYMRVYEILWQLPAGTLGDPAVPSDIERDAKLSARVLRTYSNHWFTCLKNLAYIFKAYIPPDIGSGAAMMPSFDSVVAGEDALDKVWGFASTSGDEEGKPGPRAYDGALDGLFKAGAPGTGQGTQPRLPTDYLNTLQYIGALPKDGKEKAMIQYYTELALPHVVPFPTVDKATSDPIHEGSEQWTVGEDVDSIDIIESIKASPVIVPGITTRKVVYGDDKGAERRKEPVDVDIYLDSSGSMGDPKLSTSYPVIAAFIIALSALRAGAAVQVTSYSGANMAKATRGFSRNKDEILRTVLHFFGDGTQFPCQILERYEARAPDAPPVHIIVVSDDDISSMVAPYQAKNQAGVLEKKDGLATLKRAIEKGKARGSLLLRLLSMNAKARATIKVLEPIGFEFHNISDWKQIVQFAKEFSRKHFT